MSRVSVSKWVPDQGAQSGQGWERPPCVGGKAGALGCLQAATAWTETVSSCSCLVPGRQAWRERKPNPLIGSAETSPASTWIGSIPLQFISSSPTRGAGSTPAVSPGWSEVTWVPMSAYHLFLFHDLLGEAGHFVLLHHHLAMCL